MPNNRDIVLVADSYQEAVAAITWARRVGVDRIGAYLNGGMAAWATDGNQLIISISSQLESLYKRITEDTAL
jgi:hypothetical protein